MNAASKKILIADADASIRLVLSQAFTRLGYQVRATGNAATLLKWVSDGEGDLVVTDVVMPDENVFNVLPRIKKQRPKLPVIVMSAQNNLITAVDAADLTVLSTGESGSGKELVARALHDMGRRRDGRFVVINLAAVPRERVEPELFGKADGAV